MCKCGKIVINTLTLFSPSEQWSSTAENFPVAPLNRSVFSWRKLCPWQKTAVPKGPPLTATTTGWVHMAGPAAWGPAEGSQDRPLCHILGKSWTAILHTLFWGKYKEYYPKSQNFSSIMNQLCPLVLGVQMRKLGHVLTQRIILTFCLS